MKSKKVIKRLSRVVTLLSDVLSEYPAIEKQVRELLSAARASIVGARKFIDQQVSAGAAVKSVKSKTAQQSRLTAAGKSKSPLASKAKTAPAKPKIKPKAASANAKSRAPKAKRAVKRKGAIVTGHPALPKSLNIDLKATTAAPLPVAQTAKPSEAKSQGESLVGAPQP